MSEPDNADERRRRIMSALADGEADSSECDAVFRAWREDESCRSTWHAYQLIGDVLRRDDLANAPARDSALLLAVRARLADEPVVLAPSVHTSLDDAQAPAAAAVAGGRPAPRAPRGVGRWARAHWQGPAAMAAGFVLVAGGLMLKPVGDNAPAVAVANPQPLSHEQAAPYLTIHRQWGDAALIQTSEASARTVSLTQPAR
jgi:sigma-E factor negative regulatory protein RseA